MTKRIAYAIPLLFLLLSNTVSAHDGAAIGILFVVFISGGGLVGGAIAGIASAFNVLPKFGLVSWAITYLIVVGLVLSIAVRTPYGFLGIRSIGIPSLVIFLPTFFFARWLTRRLRETPM